MLIENRNLKPGTRLVGHYHKQSFTCEVIEGEGDKPRYRLQDGREFKSPSSAAVAITGKSVNGWAFWSVEQAAAVASEDPMQPEQGGSSAPSTAEPGQTLDYFMRTASQKGASEGQTRWYCPECGESFIVPAGGVPESCPKGHKA